VITSRTKRLIVAGLRGSSGKTILSLGLAREWTRRGARVAPFKKGPDYIDAHWLSMAADGECRNLDTYLAREQHVLRSFIEWSRDADMALVEGNRGIFDGLDEAGTYSTAQLAKLLNAPLVLIVDCTKTTRTAAAMVAGCRVLEPDLPMAGVILNRVANSRHGNILKRCIEGETGLPVVGSLPKLSDFPFPERHLGLVMPLEHEAAWEAINAAADLVRDCVDLDLIWDIASKAEELSCEVTSYGAGNETRPPVKIGIVRDAAFSFYYPDNLEQLRREGAELIEIDALNDTGLPDISALYIGGGFPETLAGKLAENEDLRRDLRRAADGGLPIYAECGGAMYLGESILYKGATYPMVGALPITYELCKKPQGHGYTELEVTKENPFYEVGKKFRGHEFHYSKALTWERDAIDLVMKNARGRGFDGAFDGVCRANILAVYSHVHDLYGNTGWARGMVEGARRYAECDACGANMPIADIRVESGDTGVHVSGSETLRDISAP